MGRLRIRQLIRRELVETKANHKALFQDDAGRVYTFRQKPGRLVSGKSPFAYARIYRWTLEEGDSPGSSELLLQYFQVLREIAKKSNCKAWFVEQVCIAAFTSYSVAMRVPMFIAICDIDKFFDLPYKEVEKAVRRWAKRPDDFRDYLKRKLYFKGE